MRELDGVNEESQRQRHTRASLLNHRVVVIRMWPFPRGHWSTQFFQHALTSRGHVVIENFVRWEHRNRAKHPRGITLLVRRHVHIAQIAFDVAVANNLVKMRRVRPRSRAWCFSEAGDKAACSCSVCPVRDQTYIVCRKRPRILQTGQQLYQGLARRRWRLLFLELRIQTWRSSPCVWLDFPAALWLRTGAGRERHVTIKTNQKPPLSNHTFEQFIIDTQHPRTHNQHRHHHVTRALPPQRVSCQLALVHHTTSHNHHHDHQQHPTTSTMQPPTPPPSSSSSTQTIQSPTPELQCTEGQRQQRRA